MATRDPMPNRVVRVSNDDWSAYQAVCDEKGISRSDDLRMYIKKEVAAWRKKQLLERRLRHLSDEPDGDIL